METIIPFALFTALICVVNGIIAVLSFRRKTGMGVALGLVLGGSFFVALMYFFSICFNSYLATSIFSSIQFLAMDVMLLALLYFSTVFTLRKTPRHAKVLYWIFVAYGLFELVCFSINVFVPFVIDYIPREGAQYFAFFTYKMGPLYYGHLAYSYVLVACALGTIIAKGVLVPKEYKRQYWMLVGIILFIILINALFLFLPKEGVLSIIDNSVLFYGVAGPLLYWATYSYSHSSASADLKSAIFSNIGQGLVLFDYEDRLVLHNSVADRFLGKKTLDAGPTFQDFLTSSVFPIAERDIDNPLSFLHYASINGKKTPLRVDYRPMRNKKDQLIGRMFCFADATNDIDYLTGFNYLESYERVIKDYPFIRNAAMTVAAIDINCLGLINSSQGRQFGDEAVKRLSDLMRKHMPKGTYFIRGHEAILLAVMPHTKEEEALAYLSEIDKAFDYSLSYCVALAPETSEDVQSAILSSQSGLRAKKLLDPNAIHSTYLNSLIKALEECDSDSQAQAERTKLLAAQMADKLALSDVDKINLLLVTALHDIGKMGIPLEILNKPGRLDSQEFEIVKTHVEKGYNIAMSSPDLNDVALAIRHHHERYDGHGYPDGLTGANIPLASRIVSIIDSYDAMVHDRVYRPALTPNEAIHELTSNAGSQFDPSLVSRFIEVLEEQGLIDGKKGRRKAQSEAPREIVPIVPRTVYPVHYSRYILDQEHTIIDGDENFFELTGYTVKEAVSMGLKQMDLIPEADLEEYKNTLSNYLKENGIAYFQHRLQRRDGSMIYVNCCGRLYFDSATKKNKSEIIISSLSDLQGDH